MNSIDPYVVEVIDHGQNLDIHRDNVDVVVYFQRGTKYIATFFTIDNLRKLFDKNRATGECRSGKYLWAANMIIVESLNKETITEAISDLLDTEEFEKAFDGPYPIE